MYLGLDIGRQYVKMTAVEKTKEGYKILDAGYRSVPDVNTAFDPEKIDRSHLVMAVRELFKQQNFNPKKANHCYWYWGISASIKQITTMEMPTMSLSLQ